jgi:hypothetical protein
MMSKLASLAALLCVLTGCSTAPPREDGPCIAGNPSGSLECQTRVYRDTP